MSPNNSPGPAKWVRDDMELTRTPAGGAEIILSIYLLSVSGVRKHICSPRTNKNRRLAVFLFAMLQFHEQIRALSPTRATARKVFSTVRGCPFRRMRHKVFAGTPPEVSRQRFCTRGLEQISRM